MFYLRSHDKLSRISGFFIILLLLIPSILTIIPIPEVYAVDSGRWQITTSSDDCFARQYPQYLSTTQNGFYFGDAISTAYDYEGGLRFQSVTIPQGATILTAVLNVSWVQCYYSDHPEVIIQGEDIDDSTTFSNFANYDARVRTSESALWQTVEGIHEEIVISPDFASVIQEIVNIVDWESGNSLAIFVSHALGWGGVSEECVFHSYDDDSALASWLQVTWSATVPPYITFYNQSSSLFMMNGTKIINGTITMYDNGTLLELQGVINKSFTFTYWNWITSYAEINPYNFTVAGNDTIWLMVDPVGAGGLSSSWVLSGFLWILLILCPIIVIVLWRLR